MRSHEYCTPHHVFFIGRPNLSQHACSRQAARMPINTTIIISNLLRVFESHIASGGVGQGERRGGGGHLCSLPANLICVTIVDCLRHAGTALTDRRALSGRFFGESNTWQRRQYQTDMVRQKNQSVEDVRKRDDVKTAMLVNRSGVHRVTRKGAPS